jgi:hypothetical protein
VARYGGLRVFPSTQEGPSWLASVISDRFAEFGCGREKLRLYDAAGGPSRKRIGHYVQLLHVRFTAAKNVSQSCCGQHSR